MKTQSIMDRSIVLSCTQNRSRSRLTDNVDSKKIWLDLPYNGKEGESLVKSLMKKLKRFFKGNFNIVVKQRTNKLFSFCPTKDRISWNRKANVNYIIHPGCHNDYVGKTYINLITRLSEHGGKRQINPCSKIFGLIKSLIANQILIV